ncbi:MAG: hypothetical protein HY901_01585 [Deltaproteobacteria bacterium]|nr:hypothetical protein [Deltaproteobacteria bacterium]
MRTLYACLVSSGVVLVVACCGGKTTGEPPLDAQPSEAADASVDGGGAGDAQVQADTGTPLPPTEFATVTASTLPYEDSFPTVTTFRVPFTTMRAGTQVKVALWGHLTGMNVREAWLGRYLGSGTVEGNTPLLFSAQKGVSLAPGAVALSDPLPFVVAHGGRYAVSFAATGTVPSGQDIVSDGVRASGNVAGLPTISGGTRDVAVYGVKYVAVLGERQRVIAVLGDSIGAGMAAGTTEGRFVGVAQQELAFPVVDASEGGDGVERAYFRIDSDVLALPGITDCVVEIGINDLHREYPPFVIDGLTKIFLALRRAGLRTWGGTIIPNSAPKRTEAWELTRQEVNAFIQSTDLVDGVVDFAAALADPADPTKPAAGLMSQDGIHPSTAGHRVMGETLARAVQGSRP